MNARLADAALGSGWPPWMKLVLIDSEHHRTGNPTPVATAYKIYRGELALSENLVYLRQMLDGRILQADSYEPLFGDLLQEPHPMRRLEIKGKMVPAPRWRLCWSALASTGHVPPSNWRPPASNARSGGSSRTPRHSRCSLTRFEQGNSDRTR
jgi:hypothetical protein